MILLVLDRKNECQGPSLVVSFKGTGFLPNTLAHSGFPWARGLLPACLAAGTGRPKASEFLGRSHEGSDGHHLTAVPVGRYPRFPS